MHIFFSNICWPLKVWHFAHVRSTSKIGDGCIIGKSVYIDAEVVIGNNVKIQNGVSVYHGVTIEDDVFCGLRDVSICPRLVPQVTEEQR